MTGASRKVCQVARHAWGERNTGGKIEQGNQDGLASHDTVLDDAEWMRFTAQT